MTLHDLKKPVSGDKCLLCGARPDMIGVFVPDDQAAFGGVQGKTRMIRYCLCSMCQSKPDAQDRIEKVIRAEVAGGLAHAS